MAEVTFRDFAMAVMQGNLDGASTTLETLLGLPAAQARAASEHFRARSTDPSFLPKAMGLRTAVTTGSDAQISELLADCFGLADDALATGVTTIRTRYPQPG